MNLGRVRGFAIIALVATLALSSCDWLNLNPPGRQATVQPSTASPSAESNTPGSTQPVVIPTVPQVRPCAVDDLNAVAGWQGLTTGSVVGAVRFNNKSLASCGLQGWPGVHMMNVKGDLMPVAYLKSYPQEDTPAAFPISPTLITVRPGATAFVSFTWVNWCGPQEGPYRVVIALPGEGGQLTILGRDLHGNPISYSPSCDDPSVISTISVGPFSDND